MFILYRNVTFLSFFNVASIGGIDWRG